MNPLLEISNLFVQFNTQRGLIQAVRGINLKVYPGEIVGLVGESGCGKSVTAQSIMKLLENNSKVTGKIVFNGVDIIQYNEKDMELIRGKKIGMIFQDPLAALNPTMRVGSQIMESIEKHKSLSNEAAKQKTLTLLHLVGIGDPLQRINQYPHELSGGQRQRLLIAMAIACEPDLIIADEPTTALDVTIQMQILDLLKKIQKQQNLSMLLISHDLGVIAKMCSRVLVMYAGKIVEEASTRKLFTNPQHPYTKKLIESKTALLNENKPILNPIPGISPNLIEPIYGCSFAPRCSYAQEKCFSEEPTLVEEKKVACWFYDKDNK